MDEVLFAKEGQLGLITLNRPSALNALTLSMILALQKQLELLIVLKLHAPNPKSTIRNPKS